MIVSIDPGLRGCGVAVWAEEWSRPDLLWAGYVKNPGEGRGADAWRAMADSVVARVRDLGGLYLELHALVVESQQIYGGYGKTSASARRGDLTELTGVAATLCALIPARTYLQPLPAEWKRNKEKKAKCAEIAREATARGWADRVQLPKSAKLQLDVWDAVGLGLWAFVRLRVTAKTYGSATTVSHGSNTSRRPKQGQS